MQNCLKVRHRAEISGQRQTSVRLVGVSCFVRRTRATRVYYLFLSTSWFGDGSCRNISLSSLCRYKAHYFQCASARALCQLLVVAVQVVCLSGSTLFSTTRVCWLFIPPWDNDVSTTDDAVTRKAFLAFCGPSSGRN